jgi:chitodextrinase
VEITYTNGAPQTIMVNKTDTPNNSKVITGLTNGTEYTFTVKTVDAAGNASAGVPVSATPANTIPSDTTPPGEAGSLTATPGDRQITLSWTNPTDSDFHHVEISWTSAHGSSTSPTTSTGISQTITGLTNGTAYNFTVKTVDAAGNKSSGVSASATPADTTAPGEASGLAASPGDRQVSLSWTNPADSDFDHVEITYTNGSPQPLPVNKTATPNNSAVITGLTNGTE